MNAMDLGTQEDIAFETGIGKTQQVIGDAVFRGKPFTVVSPDAVENHEVVAFNPHDQRFTFSVTSNGSVYLATEGEDFTRCQEMDAHSHMLRKHSTSDVTHWRVRRSAFCEPQCESVYDGAFISKRGPVADFLIALAVEGGINDPVNEHEAEVRRQDAEYDLRSARDTSDTDRAIRAAIDTGSWT